jgi:hypothetical protein
MLRNQAADKHLPGDETLDELYDAADNLMRALGRVILEIERQRGQQRAESLIRRRTETPFSAGHSLQLATAVNVFASLEAADGSDRTLRS